MNVKRDAPYLLVVTVLNGRNFPQRPAESLRIDVRFDGQLLSSLPVPMAEEPVFDVDMAYRLTGAQLTKHKVQRTPIKIDVMKVNRKTKRAEKIGYKILDLRVMAVELGKPRFTWFPLLGAQALRGKPEIHLGVSVDDDAEALETARSQKEFTRSARKKDYWVEHQPVLVMNADGTSDYEIGPSKDSTHVYEISLVVGYASNLRELFQNVQDQREFFFHYEIMGNHLTTQPFKDYESSDFSPERISLRIRSHYALLKHYFLHQRSLKIELCEGEGSIVGRAELAFDELFPVTMTEIEERVTLEKELFLHPLEDNTSALPPHQHPLVGVAFQISVLHKTDKRDFGRTQTVEPLKAVTSDVKELSKTSRPTSAKAIEDVDDTPSLSSSRRSQSAQNINHLTHTHHTHNHHTHEGNSADSGYYASLPRHPPTTTTTTTMTSVRHTDEYATGEGGEDHTQSAWKREHSHQIEKVNGKPLDTTATQVSPLPSVVSRRDEETDRQTNIQTDNERRKETLTRLEWDGASPDIPSATPLHPLHHYVCTIYLYKLCMTSENYTSTPLYLRYQYPFFGSGKAIVTRPPLHIPPREQVVLDTHSLTQFTFGCKEKELKCAFRTVPLCVEVWKYGGQGGGVQDELIGQGKFRMDLLFRSDAKTFFQEEKSFCRRTYDISLQIVDLQTDKYPKLGELTVCTTLDDYGAVQHDVIDVPSVVETSSHVKRPPSVKTNLQQMEKQTAFELEVWKEKEENKFKSQLRKREEEALRRINEEWEERTKEQKAHVAESVHKYKDLETELRTLILHYNQKEKSLSERESRVKDAERYVKSEKRRLTEEIERVERNVIEEYSKRLSLEHSAQTLLKTQINTLTSHNEEMKRRCVQMEDEISRLKDDQRQMPFQLRQAQMHIDTLTQQRNEMEGRLVSAVEKKDEYKEEWSVALHEITKLRQRKDVEQTRLNEEKDREMASLRLRLQQRKEPSPDSHHDDTPRKQRLAMQFNAVEANHNGDVDTPRRNGHVTSPTDGHDSDDSKEESEGEGEGEEGEDPESVLVKCMEERNVLLKTGIYKARHSVIVELDRKILHLQAQMRRSRGTHGTLSSHGSRVQ